MIIVTDVNTTSKRAFLQKGFGVFLSKRSPWIIPSARTQIENIDVQVARVFFVKIDFEVAK